MPCKALSAPTDCQTLMACVIWKNILVINRGSLIMKLIFRLLVLLIVVPSAFFFIYWLPFSLIPLDEHRWIARILSLFCAIGVGFYLWSKSKSPPHGLISHILYGAIVLGGIGFFVGFFGPIIFTPDAAQGPLLGIFITGPVCFLLGAIGGSLYWWIYRKKKGTKIEQ
ncbi:MAG: hypothetical protein PF545_01355 [Elusimicrobia bacterium]|jgi:hypothetical protein|nr:hypothetical protein [Elusimicrobiota bacterium]